MKIRNNIDIARLRSDLSCLQSERSATYTSGQRRRTGSMALLRALLPELIKLREHGSTWNEIAEALSRQGVVQSHGELLIPITGRRITALIASLRHQEARRREYNAHRANRADVPFETIVSQCVFPQQLTLSPDLMNEKRVEQSPLISEETIRRAALANVKSILKKDV